MLTHRFSVNSPASVVFFLWHRLITHPTFFSPLPFAVVFCSSMTVRGCSVAKRVLALWNFRGWKEGPYLVGSFAHRSARFLGRRHQIGKTANALTRQAFFFCSISYMRRVWEYGILTGSQMQASVVFSKSSLFHQIVFTRSVARSLWEIAA